MATTNQLQFLKSYTVEQFLREVGVKRIDVKFNEKTSKHFMTFGAETGAVGINANTSLADIQARPMVSLVKGDDGAEFYMLHKEGQGSPTICSFE